MNPDLTSQLAERSWVREALAVPLRMLERYGGRGGRVYARRAVDSLPNSLAKRGTYLTPRHGLWWETELQDNLQRALFFRGATAISRFPFLVEMVRADDIVLDVGANVGTFAIPLAVSCGCLVYAIEPATDAQHKLQRHVQLNGLTSSVFPHQVAFGKRRDWLELRGSPKYGPEASSARSMVSDGPVIEVVPVVRMDEWISQMGIPRVDVVKIDVEGFELNVLEGMVNLSARAWPRVILAELLSQSETFEQANDFLFARGYKAYGHDGVAISKLSNPQERPRDVLFISEG